MKLKQKCKIALDVCMTLLLFVLMAYQITGSWPTSGWGRQCSSASSPITS